MLSKLSNHSKVQNTFPKDRQVSNRVYNKEKSPCMWIDSHAHLNILEKKKKEKDAKESKEEQEKKNENLNEPTEWTSELENSIQKLKNTDFLQAVVNVSTGVDSYQNNKTLALQNLGFLFCTSGIDPYYAQEYSNDRRKRLLRELDLQLKDGISVAVGECGLDYYWNYGTPELQKCLLEDQIHLAKIYKLPLILHARNCYADLYSILRAHSPLKGVLHCYSGDKTYATKFLDLGFFLSFSGNVTFKNAKIIQESCHLTPLDRILIETDSPYLAPVPFRGKTNHPSLIHYTAEFVAQLKKVPLSLLSEKTRKNTIELFDLPISL